MLADTIDPALYGPPKIGWSNNPLAKRVAALEKLLALVLREQGFSRRGTARLLGLPYSQETRWLLDDVDSMRNK